MLCKASLSKHLRQRTIKRPFLGRSRAGSYIVEVGPAIGDLKVLAVARFGTSREPRWAG
jgi:hypothetical protein